MLTPLIPGEPAYAECLEKTTPGYFATIKDAVGNPLPAASLTTLTLRVWVIKSDGTRSDIRGSAATGQNVLNTNNVLVDSNGNLIWGLTTTDTTLIEDLPDERHYCEFEWTWPSSQNGKHLIFLNVKRLPGA